MVRLNISRPSPSYLAFALLGCVTGVPCLLSGQTIDFEHLPGGSLPTPGMQISNQFAAAFGVSFQMDDSNGNSNGNYPRIAKVDDASFPAFVSASGLTNHPATNQNLGAFFLTSNIGYGKPPRVMTVSYVKPTAAASGVITDLDQQEYWYIYVYSTNGNFETIELDAAYWGTPAPNVGDGTATPWSVSHTNADIYAIEFYGNNGNNAKMGWALDNFSPYTATPPPTLSLQRIERTNQLAVAGMFGTTNQILYASSLAPAIWHLLANAVLTNAPVQFYTDPAASNDPGRFYRAVRLP